MSILIAESRQPGEHASPAQSADRLHELVSDRDAADSVGRPGYARVLLNHARMRTATAPPPSWLSEHEPNACYANTVAAVCRPQASAVTYVEGYAYLAGLDVAFEHAWLQDEGGRVIETTWSTPGQAYFGLPFTLERLHALVDLDPCEPFLFGDWARGFPTLRAHAACCDLPWFAPSRVG